MRPKPVNRSVPIIIGGHTEAAARRAGRLGDGFFPGRGLPMELIDVVRRTARDAGRDPAAVEITMGMPDDVKKIPELSAAGVSRLLLPVTGVAGLARQPSRNPRFFARFPRFPKAGKQQPLPSAPDRLTPCRAAPSPVSCGR